MVRRVKRNSSPPKQVTSALSNDLLIRDPSTGELMQFTKREHRLFHKDRKAFYIYLRKKLGIPEPEWVPTEEMVFFWDDNQPYRRLRAFAVRS